MNRHLLTIDYGSRELQLPDDMNQGLNDSLTRQLAKPLKLTWISFVCLLILRHVTEENDLDPFKFWSCMHESK